MLHLINPMAVLSGLNITTAIRFKKIQNKRPNPKRLYNLAVGGTVLLALSSWSQGCNFVEARSGSDLFNDVVLAPMPESVRILHSQDEPSLMDPWVWLHFEATPESLAEIEAAYDWMPSSDFERDESDALAGEWWQVDQLEDGQAYEVFVEEQCRCLKEMWVDAEAKEVYFKVSF